MMMKLIRPPSSLSTYHSFAVENVLTELKTCFALHFSLQLVLGRRRYTDRMLALLGASERVVRTVKACVHSFPFKATMFDYYSCCLTE